MSGYHSPHLPALHPKGFDGACTQVPRVGRTGAVEQPALYLGIDEHRVRPTEIHRPADVIEQHLRQVAVSEGTEAFRQIAPIARRRPRKPRRAPGVGQELGVVELLGRASKLELKPRNRIARDLVGDRVVFPVVVVVLQEEHRYRPEVAAVDWHDLGAGRRLHRRLVARPEHGGREVEIRSPTGVTEPARIVALPCMEIPVDVVAVRHRRIRLERQRPTQQAIANDSRQVVRDAVQYPRMTHPCLRHS